jgi:hypothetical protein
MLQDPESTFAVFGRFWNCFFGSVLQSALSLTDDPENLLYKLVKCVAILEREIKSKTADTTLETFQLPPDGSEEQNTGNWIIN